MTSQHFPLYTHHDSINSLVTKCVHVLCHPQTKAKSLRKRMPSNNLASLYDMNLLNESNCKISSKAPSRYIELLYQQFKAGAGGEGDGRLRQQSRSFLDIHARQSIIDYITRERLLVTADLVIDLLADGGVYRFDMWQLCTINEFTSEEIERILDQMAKCAHVFQSLSIGGNTWIYDHDITVGVLRNFFATPNSLCSLVALKLQQLPFELVSVLASCPALFELEIAQPSLSDRDIFQLSSHLCSHPLSVCNTLRSVILPSSVKEEGVARFLSHFPKVQHLRCTPFEQMLDWIEESPICEQNQKTLKTLWGLQRLSIAHPMSGDMVDRLLQLCPSIRQLCLEVQEGMCLDRLTPTAAPCLQRLELHNSPTMPINFLEHVVPVLESIGHQLEHLSLEYFEHIDLIAIARLCPRLQTLGIQWFSVITLQTRYQHVATIENAFAKLECLRLRPRPHQTLSPEVCLALLKRATNLRHIELYCCTELTDDTILVINQSNPLRKLQTFILRHGHSVTNEALCRLVSSASLANSLVFHDCGLVPPIKKEDM